jgi:two-component system nitrate/nitrite response regulator NarL
MACVRILVVDDHEAIRRGLGLLLSTHAEWSICAEASNGVEAIEKAKILRPDVILMDVSMPIMDGIQATRILRTEVPESVVLIFSQNDREIVGRQAREAGASGFVAKHDLASRLIPMLRTLVLHGK